MTIWAAGFVSRWSEIGKLEQLKFPAEYRLEAAGSLKLRVVDEEGGPLPEAFAVTLKEGDTEPLAQRLVASPEEHEGMFDRVDPEGRLVLRELAFGPVVVILQAPRRRAILVSATVIAGETIDLGDVVLPAASRLTGWVTGPSGEPLEGAEVRLRPWLGHLKGRPWRPTILVETEFSGTFEFWPRFPDGMTYELLATDKKGRLRALELLDEVPGEPVELRLRHGRRVAGKVVDKNSGKPVNRCQLRTETEPTTQAETTDSEGNFDFEEAPEGAFMLSFSCAAPMFSFAVAESAASPLLIEIEAWPALRGRVLGAEAKPLRNVAVSLGEESSWTAQDGTFELKRVPPDGKKLAVKSAAGLFVADRRKSTNAEGDLEIKVPESGFLPFEGLVADAKEETVDALVMLLQGRTVVGTQKTEPDSTFSFGNVQDGDYSLRLSAGGQVFDFPTFRLSKLRGPLKVELRRTRLEGQVAGRYEREAGRLFVTAWRDLERENTPFVFGDPTTTGFESVKAEISADGTFFFEGLADGEWNIRAGIFGRRNFTDTRVSIRSGKPPDSLIIELPKED